MTLQQEDRRGIISIDIRGSHGHTHGELLRGCLREEEDHPRGRHHAAQRQLKSR